MKSLEEIKDILRDHEEFVRQQFRVTEMRIFGSYARGEQTEESDLDILISYDNAPTLWMLFELRDYLSQRLGMPVDVVTDKGLKLRIEERVLAEAIKI